MLDDVEGRAFLVQPAGEYALPAFPWLLDIELNESTCEPLIFPRRGSVAGAQTHNCIAIADRLPGLQGNVADNAVALVEQPQHCDTLGHGSYPRNCLDSPGQIDGDGIRTFCALGIFIAHTSVTGHAEQR